MRQFKAPKFAAGDTVKIRGTNVAATIVALSPLHGRSWYILEGTGGYYDESELLLVDKKKPLPSR